MDMKELAAQYRQSAAACRERACALERSLAQCDGGSEAMSLRRRISLLRAMAAETSSTARYLENYYERNDTDGGEKQAGGDGVYEIEELCAAVGRARRGKYANRGRADGQYSQSKAEKYGENVLHTAASHAGDRKTVGRKRIHDKQRIEGRPGENESMSGLYGRRRGAAQIKG